VSPVWIIGKKELRLLLRDRRAALLLIAMPLLFILILGLLLGESFGQKPDDRTRVSIVDLDQGSGLYPGVPWSKLVERDLAETAGIRVETIPSLQEAERLIAEHRRPAVLILEPEFTAHVNQCSFLKDGINPFYRDGVELDRIHARVLEDAKQPSGAAVIKQVVQVTLLRVILPYMIGKAFERLSDPTFIRILGNEVRLPVPGTWRLLVGKDRISLNDLLELAAGKDTKEILLFQQKVGLGVQNALRQQFSKYDLTGKTWDTLTKAVGQREGEGAEVASYVDRNGLGIFNRGAARYQVLVPSYTVMFAFFLVLTVGWLFVSERRQGTLKRLRAAPLLRSQILLGKLVPCFVVSLVQGIALLVAGKLVFGMHWGPNQWSLLHQFAWLLPVVVATSFAAVGLAMLVAAVARTEVQVALYGAVVVLVLALIGGCVLPREMMPENTRPFTLLTPQGWALEAYSELLTPSGHTLPNLQMVGQACGALMAFGAGFLGLAWGLMRLD
jgi:ABC-type Na+ efflux pump permease subunit